MVLNGVEELEGKLNKLARDVQRKLLTTALKNAADLTRERASELAPVRTGRLKKEEIIVKVGAESTLDHAVVRVGPSKDAFYGLFQEIGTIHMTARPFLRPAFEETKTQVYEKAAKEFIEAVNEAI